MWYSYRELIYRVGTFFLMVGLGLILLFILSEAAKYTIFSYFCWGLVLLIIGFYSVPSIRSPFHPVNDLALLRG